MQQTVPCPRCGQPNQPGQRFCWHCGSSLATGCPNCGNPLDPGSRFCGNCGAQMPAMQQQAGWGQQPPPQQQQQQPGWGPPPQQPGWGQPPPQQQQPGWGQPPPQQPDWGQQPPQQPGWGQPPPQQSGWNQPPPQQQQPGWGQPPPQQSDWGQGMQRSSGGSGLVLILVVLLIALGAFSYFAFFSENPPWGNSTGSGTTSATPLTTGVLVFVKSTDAATNKAVMEMHWETSADYKGQVEYGTTDTYGSTTTLETNFTKTHVASLPNLDMNSTYHYRIVLQDKNNEVWKSDDSRFNTPAPAASE